MRLRIGLLAASVAFGVSAPDMAAAGDAIGDLLSGGRPAPDRPVGPDVTGSIDAVPLAPLQAAPARPIPYARPAPAPDGDYPVDLLISLANDAVFTPDPYPKGRRSDPRMIKLQVLLDRNNASPGVIDGMFGDNVVKGVMAFEEMTGHPVDGVIDAELWAELTANSVEPVLVAYVITAEDVAGPFVPDMPHDYAEQAQLAGLSYRDAAELLAERFHMDEAFLRRINPDVGFAEAGAEIVVANPGRPLKAKVANIVADKGRKQIRGYDAAGRLIAAFPATIGSNDMPSPTGTHAVKAIAINPDYWYRPKVNFVQGTNTSALRLPPGPNGPVGATWVGLDKPTYGLHGTPEPSKIDKTNSHGCVRLTNWDARELAGLVQPGVPVEFREPTGAMAEAAPIEAEPATEEAPRMEQRYEELPEAAPHIPTLSERRAQTR